MKKYIPVFGDQSMFENAPLDCVVCIKADREYTYYLDGNKSNLTGRIYSEDGHFFIAMRRIVEETPKAEPKRWTVEDQKAGRLPEVGSIVMVEEVETKDNIFEFAGVCAGSKRFAVKDITDGFLYFYSKEMITPIETPEEKAQRLRDEWVVKAIGETAVFAGVTKAENERLKIHLNLIHDALLSGELTAPKGGE